VALVIGLATLAAASLGLYFFIDQKGYKLKKSNDVSENFQGEVSMAEMAAHTEPEDCWMELHGNVYDLTDYAPDHPGGPEYVTDYCGMNATLFYDMEHSTSLLTLISKYNLGKAVSESSAFSDAAAPEDEPSPSVPVGSSGDEDGEESGDMPQDSPAPPVPEAPSPAAPSPPQAPTPAVPVSPPEGCPVQYYAAATVAEHADELDCWYTLYGTVYDLTVYVNEHPGGKHS
jgi:cytochrome b involved in lipid metabolism